MKEKFFACWFRLDQKDQYLIWIEGEEEDWVWLEDNLYIPVFRSETALAQYAELKNLAIVNQEPVLHHLDSVEQWVQYPEEDIDCKEVLTAWNLFADVVYALDVPFSGNKKGGLRNSIYDKLFFGTNTYGLIPDGEFYIPQWTLAERKKLTRIIKEGLTIFRNSIRSRHINE